MDSYLLLIVIILGLVEGMTEFLPISSSFHVAFIGNELGFNDGNRIKFILNIFLQLGAIFSVVVVFWGKFSGLFGRTKHVGGFLFFDKSCLHIILGILPILILGSVFYEYIESIFQIRYMFYSLIFGGILLLLSELFSCKFYSLSNKIVSEVNSITYLQAFLVGCFQCLALFPGFSRFGATISGGLLVGMNRYVASVFSFFLAVPIMIGATALALYKNFYTIFLEDLLFFVVGFFVSFIVSFLTIKIFIRIIRSVSFIIFAIYRFIVAFLVYFFDFI